MADAARLIENLREFVVLPQAYVRVRSLLQDPNSCLEDFVQAVRLDPVLAARVLRVANSAFFGVSRKVETLGPALGLMGVSRLHDLVLADAVIGTLSALPAKGLDMAAFWRRSMHTGILARMLAGAASGSRLDGERLFVSGLLHDIGHLVLHAQLPAETAAALARSRAEGIALHAAEQAALGFHFGDVGAALMANWSFPVSLAEICRLQVEPERARTFARECALVHLARHAVLERDPDKRSLPHIATPAAATWECVGLTPDTLEQQHALAAEHLAEAIEVLVPARAAA